MDIAGCRALIVITAIIGSAFSHYEETYNGYIFTLPEDKEMQSPLKLNLSKASEWCVKNLNGSMLPRIDDDRNSIVQFIRRANSRNRLNNGQEVLVNGIRHTSGNWSWINGQEVKGIDVKERWTSSQIKAVSRYNYGFLWTEGNYSIHASLPTVLRNYICEYENLSSCLVIIDHKCYRNQTVMLTWDQARDSCLREKGMLASFNTLRNTTLKVSLRNLSLGEKNHYWIGSRRNTLHLDDKGSEIKFINWTDVHKSDISSSCLCLKVADELRWIECDCDYPTPFICLRRQSNYSVTSAMTTKGNTSYQLTASVDPPSTITETLSTNQSPSNKGTEFVVVVVSCAGIFVVMVVISAVLIIRKRRKRNAQNELDSRAVGQESSLYECPNYAMQSSTDSPVYQELIQEANKKTYRA